jgi:hypothetical protein
MQVTGEGWVKLTRDLAGGSRREMDVLVRQLERARDAIGGDPVGQAFDAALQQSAQSAQALVDALKRAGYDTSEFQSKVDAATASEARAADAADAHSQKVDELRESEREAAAAIEARIGATIASFDSNLAAERGWVSLGESIAAASEEEDAHKRQLELTGAALDQAGLLAKSSADNYEKLTGETATAEQEQQFFRSALEQVAARFPELAPLILGYIGQLDSIPPGKHTTVTADTSQAELGLRRVGDQLRYIGEHGSIVIKGPGIGTEGKAAGGPVRGHVPIVVGERGPELFVPSTAGQIVPNHALASTGGRALGGGITYQIAVNVAAGVNPAEVGRQTVEAIRAYERRSGAAWRNN